MTMDIDKETEALFDAVATYIKAKGGSAGVIGPVEIQQWPADHKRHYRVAIHFTGNPPLSTGGNHDG